MWGSIMNHNIMNHNGPMIETKSLTKHFSQGKNLVEAVKGVTLDVAEGELVALLGPNGAGKSTTLRMLTTLLEPTSGSARIAGFDVSGARSEVRSRLGYVGQGNGAGHNQRVRDELVTQGLCYGMPKADSMAERVIVIDEGTVIADNTAAALKADLAGDHLSLTFETESDAVTAASVAEQLVTVREVAVDGCTVSIRAREGDSTLPVLLRETDARGARALTADITRPTLDDVFLTLTGRSLRESAAAVAS